MQRLILVIIAVIASHLVSAQLLESPDWCTDDVTSTVRLPSGVTCNLCPPGTYVAQDCTADNPNPQCESCTAGRFYNPCYNYGTRCLSCSDCTPYFSADGRNGTVEGEECTPTRDRVCRCSSNHFWDLKTSGCRQKTSCEKGFGVAHIATHKADTVCIRCDDGTFSDEKSLTQQCQICTDCGGGTTLRPCTNTRDTLCDFTGPQGTSTSPVSAQSRSVPQVLVPAGSTKMEAVIGGSVGGFLLFLLFLGCLWWRCRRKKQLSAPASIRRRPSQSDSEDIEMNARMLPPWTPEVPSPPATPPWTPEVPSPPATPPWTPEVPSRPATPPPTPNPDSPTFPKKISDDGCCRPLMNTEDPGPPNNAHDIYEKEANPHPLQPISLPPEDFQPSGGRLEPVGSSSNDVSFRNPVQNV